MRCARVVCLASLAGALALAGAGAGGRRAGAGAGEGQPAHGGDRRRRHAARRLPPVRGPGRAHVLPRPRRWRGRARRCRSRATRARRTCSCARRTACSSRCSRRSTPRSTRSRASPPPATAGRRGRARRRWASACTASATRSCRPTARSWTRSSSTRNQVLFQRVPLGGGVERRIVTLGHQPRRARAARHPSRPTAGPAVIAQFAATASGRACRRWAPIPTYQACGRAPRSLARAGRRGRQRRPTAGPRGRGCWPPSRGARARARCPCASGAGARAGSSDPRTIGALALNARQDVGGAQDTNTLALDVDLAGRLHAAWPLGTAGVRRTAVHRLPAHRPSRVRPADHLSGRPGARRRHAALLESPPTAAAAVGWCGTTSPIASAPSRW